MRILSCMHAACNRSGQLPGSQDTDFMVVAYDGLRAGFQPLCGDGIIALDGWHLWEGQSC